MNDENARVLLDKAIEFGEMSKDELAGAMGISQRTLRRWTSQAEKTAYPISLRSFLDVCDTLGITVTIRKTYADDMDVEGTYTRSLTYKGGNSWSAAEQITAQAEMGKCRGSA